MTALANAFGDSMDAPTTEHEPTNRTMQLAEGAMRWSGWGSPVGLAIFIASIGLLLMCLHWSGLLALR
jgi:hypothetical protein